MKLLHTSDWHLGKSLFEFSLQPDQEHFIKWLLQTLRETGADAVLLAGDIYDRPVPPVWALQLYDFFLSEATQRLGIPVLAVAGNHDSGARLEFGSSLYSTGGYHICGHLEASPHTVVLQDRHGIVKITLIPYLHPAEVRALYAGAEEAAGIKTFDSAYRRLLEGYPDDPQIRSVAVAHGFFSRLDRQGGRMELLTSDSEITIGGMDIADSGCFSAFDYVALGHLHAPQQVEADRVCYSGSPLKYSLSEQLQRKSVRLVTLEGKGKVHSEELPCPPLRDVRTVHGSFHALLDPACHENRQFADYVFAEIEGSEVPYPMEKLRTLFPHLLGLRFSAAAGGAMPTIRTGGSTPRLSAEELFSRFYQEVKGEKLSVAQQELLREIMQDNDEEVSP